MIICGDTIEILRTFKSNSVDLILTDPPYMISREVKIHRAANYKYKGKDIDLDFGEWDKQWKNEEEYYGWCKKWLSECFRILKPNRHMVFFFDKFKVTPVVKFAEKNGMKARQCLFWIKQNPVPRARCVNFMEAIEMAIWLTKGEVKRDFFNWKIGQHPNYIEAAIPQARGRERHPAEKPVKFGEWVISYLSKPGDTVLDPFCGTGAFLVAAKELGRKPIGIDINIKFCKIAKRRLSGVSENLFEGCQKY